jgi:hypothetical protein
LPINVCLARKSGHSPTQSPLEVGYAVYRIEESAFGISLSEDSKAAARWSLDSGGASTTGDVGNETPRRFRPNIVSWGLILQLERKNLLNSRCGASLTKPLSKEDVMLKAYVLPAVASVFVLGSATVAMAGEFDNMCAMGLATGQKISTNCAINEVIAGLSYCFANDNAKSMFMKDPTGNLAKAKAFDSTKKP